jgi:hypothetical protein
MRVNLLSEKNHGPIILVAVIPLHITAITSCNDTSQINMACYANQNPAILWVHVSTEIRPSFVAKQHECGVYYFNITTHEVTGAQNSLQFEMEFSVGVIQMYAIFQWDYSLGLARHRPYMLSVSLSALVLYDNRACRKWPATWVRWYKTLCVI